MLDWLRVEYGIEKPSNKLLALTDLDSNTWVSEVKRIRGKKQPLHPFRGPNDLRKRFRLSLLHSFDAIPVHVHELVRGNRGFNLGPNTFQPCGEIATAHVAHAQMDDPGWRHARARCAARSPRPW